MNTKPTVLGKTLAKIAHERHVTKKKAVDELWGRNGLASAADRDGYKLAEATRTNRDGTEITEYRLYKLIDASIITISTQVNTNIVTGAEAAKEMQRGKQPKTT